MAIPDFQTLMLPLLKLLKSGEAIKLADTVQILSDEFKLSESERKEWLPSQNQRVIYNRVS